MQRRSARVAAKAVVVDAVPASFPGSITTTTTTKASKRAATSESSRRITSASKPISKVTPNTTPDSLPIIPFKDATAFEAHLSSQPPNTTPGLWLKISKKASGIPSITYDQAIDSALCHGWIDGQRRALCDSYFLQRFTPRRKGSLWSRRNVDKVATLTAEGRMRPAGLKEVEEAKGDGRWERAYPGAGAMQVPVDFEAALAADDAARAMFETLGRTARYAFCWRIETCKRAETRRRKIGQFVAMLAEGKML